MTQNWRVRLTERAERDLEEIAGWTAENFGRRQALQYSETIALALEALAAGPEVPGVRTRDELAPGVRSLHAARQGRRARHLVLFRVTDHGILEVLRVLHDSMELARHLPGAEDSAH